MSVAGAATDTAHGATPSAVVASDIELCVFQEQYQLACRAAAMAADAHQRAYAQDARSRQLLESTLDVMSQLQLLADRDGVVSGEPNWPADPLAVRLLKLRGDLCRKRERFRRQRGHYSYVEEQCRTTMEACRDLEGKHRALLQDLHDSALQHGASATRNQGVAGQCANPGSAWGPAGTSTAVAGQGGSA